MRYSTSRLYWRGASDAGGKLPFEFSASPCARQDRFVIHPGGSFPRQTMTLDFDMILDGVTIPLT